MPEAKPSDAVRVVFLGGLGEIGRNCMCLEVEGRILVIDCGLMFPETDMPGVDLVLPDFTYLKENADRVEGVFLTHAHEDHAGGLSFLLRDLSFPIYGSPLTLGLARNRIEEAGLMGRTELIPVHDGERRWIGPFDCEFIPVTHSVPHAFATAYHTPQGTILHTGDFKLDLTPVDGRQTDLALLGEIARADGGVRLLLSDSTNAEEPGFTPSESTVGGAMRSLFREYSDKRIVVASFSSHMHRVQQVVETALANDRRIAFLGRSMLHNMSLAREMGMLSLPEDRVITIEQVPDYAPGDVAIICTGSQGEPMSALSLMAAGEHKWVKVGPDDVVVISAHAIPGNENNVGRVINGLHHQGATVVHGGDAPVHVSGHASQEELKFMLTLTKPDWFVPVHGEYRHMVHHAQLARMVGVPDDQVLICEDGDALTLTDDGIEVERRSVPAGYLYVDGIVGDVGQGVLRDRRVLAEEGVVVVIVTVDSQTGEIVNGPEIVTRGWVYAPEADDLIDEAIETVRASLEEATSGGLVDFDALRRRARQSLARFITQKTKRRPIVIPVLMEI
ncbi:MAG: putative hydrolase of the metallo-beta-lactamase superfamily [Actinomycetia bacterium]|nr:putative hydrolase of the metallo-beta-lactamase superfamily [Actinomycetes bacterium]